MSKKLTRIGFINKLSGYKGEVHCIIERGNVEDYSNEQFLFIRLDGIDVPFEIEEIKDRRGAAIIKFRYADTEEYSKRFIDKEVFTEKTGKRNKDEPDWEDLTGYEVIDERHGFLGIIKKIEEYPQQLIATFLINDKEVLIPLNENFLQRIEEGSKQIFLTLPEGLIDVYLK
jgi:16S rRNA processing protein RimM